MLEHHKSDKRKEKKRKYQTHARLLNSKITLLLKFANCVTRLEWFLCYCFAIVFDVVFLFFIFA
jgi:hypothetical protein